MATGIVHVYANALKLAWTKAINWSASTPDTMKCTLHTSSYSPDYANHDYQNDLTNEVANGNGYTTGGATLTSVTSSLVPAASLTAWASTTAYQVGEVRRKSTSDGHVYICLVAGTSGGSEPTWQTGPGATTTDNTVTWGEAGTCVLKLTGTIPTWSGSTFTTRYAVIADTTPGSAATNPLIACIDFQADQSPSAGNFTITLDTDGIMTLPIRA